jgi:prepilin-type N-terminal cleavage/methylation domain-containing protein
VNALERIRDAGGYTLVEMVTVLAIMGVVLTGITALFVQGSNAEVDQNGRFQAQQDARMAVDRLRRDGHCASSIALSGTSAVRGGVTYYPTMTQTLPSGCGTTVSWCTVAVGVAGNRFRLYRQSGSSCGTSGVRWADYLTVGPVFAYTAQSTQTLARLTVDIPVNPRPTTKPQETYELNTDIALRNSTRT